MAGTRQSVVRQAVRNHHSATSGASSRRDHDAVNLARRHAYERFQAPATRLAWPVVTQPLPQIVRAQPDATLAIVGDAPTRALHAHAQTPASIQAAADAAGVGRHLRFLGVITDYAELGAIYRAADVHVFPVRSIPGDPEGFGMVAVEAATHGLPTVAFATGGVTDAVADGSSGYLARPGDYPAFTAKVLRALHERDALRAGCTRFAKRYAWPHFGEQIATLLLDTANPTQPRVNAIQA